MAKVIDEYSDFRYEKSSEKKQEYIKIKKHLNEGTRYIDNLYICHFVEDVILYNFFPYEIDVDFAFAQTLDYISATDINQKISFNSIYNNIYLKRVPK